MPNVADLFREISVFGKLTMAVPLAAFALAAMYVFRPTERTLLLMRPVSLAAIFATISGLLSGWMSVLGAIAATADGHVPTSSLYQGIATSLTIGFVCFGLLAAAWVLIAAGMLRRVAMIGDPS